MADREETEIETESETSSDEKGGVVVHAVEVESELIKRYKSYFEIIEKTQYHFINNAYGINMTLKDFFEKCSHEWPDVQSILSDRFPLFQNQISKITQNKRQVISQLFLLSTMVETDKFLEEYHNSESAEDKADIYKEAITEYLGEEAVGKLENGEIEILSNKEISIIDADTLEDFFHSKGDASVFLFLIFRMTIDKVVISNIGEFKTKSMAFGNKKGEKVENYDLTNMLCYKLYQTVFNVIDSIFSDTAEDDGKDFTKNLIVLNKNFNDEVVTPTVNKEISEGMTTSDVSGVNSELFSGYGGYGFPKGGKTKMIKRVFPQWIGKGSLKGKLEIGSAIIAEKASKKKSKKNPLFEVPEKKAIDTTTYSERDPRRSSTYAQDGDVNGT